MPGEIRQMSWTYQYGKTLEQENGEKVDISGLSRDIHNTDTNRKRIEQMVMDAIENCPDDEEIREISVRFDPWDRPKVTIWCKSEGFNHRNSKVVQESGMVNGQLFKYNVDTRPF